jgi:hypothetical protein
MNKTKAVELYTIYKVLCASKNQAVLFDLQDFIDSNLELKIKKDINSINFGNNQDIATYFDH